MYSVVADYKPVR